MTNFCKVYQNYKDWWMVYGSSNEYPTDWDFKDHVNSMRLYDFMELMNNWDTED
jgi:hypothetical protein